MKSRAQNGWRLLRKSLGIAGLAALGALSCAAQQTLPLDKPIVIKQKHVRVKQEVGRFKGTVMNANIAQITVRGIENELAIRTFPLSRPVSEKMQQIIDRGGYQYGDKVTIVYDPATQRALKIKGKPSKAL
ncbi:MAG: hypothetical protein LAN71_08945 [Acidobacteriia bacterium]|nr:hypothetical protein [Terriglobia bacterium]